MASEFFGRQREYRFYTAGCGNKMEVSVTGPRAVNELGGPVIPGIYAQPGRFHLPGLTMLSGLSILMLSIKKYAFI